MSIDTQDELDALIRVGYVVRLTLDEMARHVRPGITTAELDGIAAAVLSRHGARSAPQLVYRFPGYTCISVNDEIVHGIPRGRRLKAGDLVKLDVTAELNGYMADAARTVAVPPVAPQRQRLITCAETALRLAIAAIQVDAPINVIGQAIFTEVRRNGFNILPELTGHGIGRTIHDREPASVPNFADPTLNDRLSDGLVFTIEPIITSGVGRFTEDDDGWTLRTVDGRPSAHFEHTVVVRPGGALVLTAA